MTVSGQPTSLSRARRAARLALVLCGAVLLSGCGNWNPFGPRNTVPTAQTAERQAAALAQQQNIEQLSPTPERNTIWDLFSNADDPNTRVEVNKYLWQASLEVLDFLPIETVDPFSGVIVTGYGAPPGGGRAYRATIYVQDPALDARSLKIALTARGGGAVDETTVRAVEDAILTRARQLRIRDGKL
jgi:hypothetical protein